MRKMKLLAIAIAANFAGQALAINPSVSLDELPKLAQEDQHAKATKRVATTFTQSHYKPIRLDDTLSGSIFERYLRNLDHNKSVFLASDIEGFKKFEKRFDEGMAKGRLDFAFEMYNLNIQRRYERYVYALSLLDQEMDFTVPDKYFFDREDADWAVSVSDLNEIWRQRVKYNALNLKMAGKDWEGIKEVLSKRYNNAIKRLKQSQSEDAFQLVMNAFARTIEAHTSYLSPRNADRFKMEMNLSLEGIGAVLHVEDDYTVIRSIVAGGPADKSERLKPEDRIVGVAQDEEDFVDVVGWRLDDVVELIKGPKGTKVRLQVLPGSSSNATPQELTLVRDKIRLEDRAAKSKVYSADAKEGVAPKLGVIEIPSFYNNLTQDVSKELTSLVEQGVEGIIIDLRGNGGGSLQEAKSLTGLFIDKGPVVQVKNNLGRIMVERDPDGGKLAYNGPLTVMVDRYSASASEIFAAAMQDYGRGVIIGENTFGKGTVQQHKGLGRIYDLNDKPLGSIQYTIAKFYRINGGSTQHKGVQPDILFPSAIEPEDWGESTEDSALPWDSIKRAKYITVASLDNEIEQLRKDYLKRIASNPEFAYLADDIIEYKARKDDKSISLVEAERKAERDDEDKKRLKRANERLVRLGKPVVKDLENLPDELSDLDPFLDEAANITFDLANSSRYAKK